VPVRVVAPGTDNRIESWEGGVSVYRYAAPAKPLSTLNLLSPRDIVALFALWRNANRTLDRAMSDVKIGHILALWALPCGAWAQRASKKHRTGYSVWALGSDIWSLGRIPILRSWLRRVIQGATNAWADGLALARDAAALSSTPVRFLPSTRAIEAHSSRSPALKPPYKLVFIGRWHKNKGPDLLLDALDILEEDAWSNIDEVSIYGGGPMDEIVKLKVTALQEKGRPLILGGFLDKVAAQEAFERADWVLIPSRIESIPLVFSDAMKLGRPVICTPVGDLPELLDGAGIGVCAKDISAESMAEAIVKALASSGSRDQNRNLADIAKRFDLSTHIVPDVLRASGMASSIGGANAR
jgi:glycosyltransferase involved in cell wall biosynthesis